MISQDRESRGDGADEDRETERCVGQGDKEDDWKWESSESESESGMINAAPQSCLWSAAHELS